MRAPFVTLSGLVLLISAHAIKQPEYYHNYDNGNKQGIVDITKLLQEMADAQTKKLNGMKNAYAKTSTQCKTDLAAASATMATYKSTIDTLTTSMGQITDLAASLKKEYEADKLRNEDLKRDIKVIKQVRDNEALEYADDKAATSGAIKALNKAISQLMDVSNLLQTSHKVHPVLKQIAERFPEHAAPIHAFLQTEYPPHNDPKNDKRAGGDVVDLLETLQVKLLEQFQRKELNEYSAKALYEEMKDELQNEADNYFVFAGNKEKEVAAYEDEAQAYQTEIDRTDKLLTAVTTVHTDTDRTCSASTKHFEKMSALISSEIAACKEATAILWAWVQKNTPASAGPVFNFQYKASLAQLRTGQSSDSARRSKLVAYLQSQSQQLNSKILAAVAQKAQIQHFGDIMKMIKDLMILLIKEATNPQTDFNWCNRHIHENYDQRKRQVSEIENLHGEIAELQSSTTTFEGQLAKAENDLAGEESTLETKTTAHTKLLDDNNADLKERKEADKALSQALLVLVDYYNDRRPAISADKSLMFAKDTAGYVSADHKGLNTKHSIASDEGDYSDAQAGFTPILSDKATAMDPGSRQGGNVGWNLHTNNNGDLGEEKSNVVDKVTLIRNRCLQEIEQMSKENEEAKEAWAVTKSNLAKSIGKLSAQVKHLKNLIEKYKADYQAKIQDLKSAKVILKEALDLLTNTLQPTCMEGSTVASTRSEERAKEIKALKQALRELNNYRGA